MQLTAESRRVRWLALVAAWGVAGILILLHTRAVDDYVTVLNGIAPAGGGQAHSALQQVIPSRFADAQLWVRLALDAEEHHHARVHFTTTDNAPVGREVHWSSAFMWLVRGAGKVQAAVSGDPPARAFERMLPWFNAALLFGLMAALSTWTARRAGAAAGVLIALAMVGHNRFYEGFSPFYVDHHGVVNAAVLGLLVGATFMGGGWWKTAGAKGATRLLPVSSEQAKSAAIASALCGAVGLWISAATVLPAIALVGVAGLAVTWWAKNDAQKAGALFEPMVWRLWGRSGAIASAAFYIIEYAPANLGWRLEVNHPLWALGWWGGAEIVASWSERLVRGRADLRTLLFPILAVAAAPLAILLGGTATFMVRDPFVGELRHFVAEGMSLPAVVGLFGFGTVSYDVISALVLVPAAVVLARRRDESRLVVGLLTIVTIGFVLMSCAEMRWWLNTAGAQIALVLGLVALAKRRAWTITISGALVLFVAPAVQRVARDFAENKRQAVSERDLMQPLYRDIAATLRESQPQGDLVLLADPNASAGIGYFGRFKTLGTLYWENAPGLRAAANIVCARMDDEAAKLIRARGVTHVAVISTSNFIGEYFRLLNPTADRAGMENTFAVRLTREPPAWLQPVPYRIPAELKSDAQFVLLFKVAFEQTDLDRLYATAIARAAAGNTAAAEQALAEALARAPVDARFALCESAASAFYDYGADAAAVAVFRRALALRNDPAIATTLAWILATTSDAPLRDGRAALALVEARARANADDPTLLSAFAAACAEVGRFPDAIAAAQRALALVRSTGDEPAAKLLQDRLAAYQAGRAWRQ